jgi:hypothetical protein
MGLLVARTGRRVDGHSTLGHDCWSRSSSARSASRGPAAAAATKGHSAARAAADGSPETTRLGEGC